MKQMTIVFGLLLCLGCAQNAWVKNQNYGNALGTTFAITYMADRKLDFQKDIDSLFHAVNRSLSTYMEDSDISKVNAGDTALVVDAMFREVFAISDGVYTATKGHFDPTVGILADAWGFGPGEPLVLDSLKVDSLLQYVGWDKVELKADHTIAKAHPAICFDFNAVAKGYTVDRLGVLLDSKGIDNYLVELGGEVLAKGNNPISGNPWTVGIDDPQAEVGRELKQIVLLEDRAMATSGNYRKFRLDPETGQKYVHTIDPLTGYTKNSKVLAVSVLANTCALADAYATAFMAMDMEESKKVLEEHGELEAYFIYLDSKGSTQEFLTEGFRATIKP